MAEEEAHAHGDGGGGHGGGHGGGGHGGGGGGHEEAHEGAPEWLISFADNVTLMMGFFVIMLAFFMRDAAQVRGGTRQGDGDLAGQGEVTTSSPELLDWALAVRAAFNNPVDADSPNPRDQLLVQRMRARSGLGAASDPGPKGRHSSTQTLRPSDYYGLGGLVQFETGLAELPPTGPTILKQITEHFTGVRSVIEIRGHVSLAEARQLANNGVALSYQRAFAIAEALAELGIEWPRMRLIACGAAEPVVSPAYDEAGQRSNQRVEIISTDQAAHESSTQPSSAPVELPPEEPETASDEN